MYCRSLLTIILLTVISLGCHKTSHPKGKLTGKLVVEGACGQYTIQVLSGPVDSALLTRSWHNTFNDSTYTNVFAATNVCQIANIGLQQGDIFTFDAAADGKDNLCYVCMIYYPTPPTHSAIENVQKIN